MTQLEVEDLGVEESRGTEERIILSMSARKHVANRRTLRLAVDIYKFRLLTPLPGHLERGAPKLGNNFEWAQQVLLYPSTRQPMW